MSFKSLTEKRVSCRDYSGEGISEEILNYIMESTRLAPSAVNRQPWKIFLAQSQDILEGLFESYPREWFRSAPQVAVFTGSKGENWIRKGDSFDYLLCDVTIAACHFVMAAEDRGLGTCYIANFEPGKVRETLKLKNNQVPLLMISFGYPAKELNSIHKRKEPGEIFVKL